MKLTGKTKEAFLEHYWRSKIKPLTICTRSDLENFFDSIYEIYQNALIIEFFDSVGIYIEVATEGEWGAYVNKEWVKTSCTDRAQATNEAIIKANDLYNENN